MLTIRAMSDGTGYSARHLEHSDYYAEGERVVGQWQGRGAELLGLSGNVESEQFEALRQSFHPETGEFLPQRHSTDRIAADGGDEESRILGYPDSVTALARSELASGVPSPQWRAGHCRSH